VQAKFYTIQKR